MGEVGEINLGDVTINKTFNWKIKYFLVQSKNNKMYKAFSTAGLDNKERKWVMALQKDGDQINFALGFFPYFCTNALTISYKISILDNNDIKQFSKRVDNFEFDPSKEGKKRSKIAFLDFNHIKANANSLLPGGTLTLSLKMKIRIKEVKRLQNNSLSTDLNEAFTNMNHSDCVILCGDEKIDCHCFMLEARSPVFKAMLGSGFQEGLTKTIKIETFSPETIKDMLQFIYTDKTEKLKSTVCYLYKAADHYQIDLLKEVMEKRLIGQLDITTALDYLVLADTYNSLGLRKAALAFIVKNVKPLMATPEWKETALEYPEVFLEVTESLVNHFDINNTPMVKKVRFCD